MRVFCWSLVKNIPFEGLSKKMIEKRIQQFLDAESFLRILQTPKSILELKRLPSLAERVFYSFCYRCLKHGWKRFLALFFVVFYPGMKGYIHKAVE